MGMTNDTASTMVPEPGRPAGRLRLCGAQCVRWMRKRLRPLHSHRDCANRDLHFDEYVSYELMYFFNPVLTSMRGIQWVSDMPSVQRKLNLRRFSLGSFSEAGRVFDADLLRPILAALVAEASDLKSDPRLSALEKALTAFDCTLIRAAPRVLWALWRGRHERAAKMHLEFHIVQGVGSRATITDANTSEGQVLRDNLAAGNLYVADRGLADYALMADILDAESSFVIRVANNAVYEVLEERPLSDAARAKGIRRDLIVRLGSKAAPELHPRRIRLVEIHVRATDALLGRRRKKRVSSKKTFRTDSGDYTLLLATDLVDVDAELIADIYRYRWQIELFFRWFKTILRAEHMLSLSQNGLTIQVYCALIASVLITLWTGDKPTKRAYETICLFVLGWIDEDDLASALDKLAPAAD